MAFDQGGQTNQPMQPNAAAEPAINEEQVRAMRGDLTQPPPQPQPEPQLSVPSSSTTQVIFDGEEPTFSPNTTNQMAPSVDSMIASQGSKKTLWWIIGGVVVLVLGAAGYFFVYPLLNNAASEPAPIVEAPVAPQAPTPPAAPERMSAFINEPAGSVMVGIGDPLSRDGIITAITQSSQAVKPGVTELVISGTTNASLPFGTYLSALAAGFTEAAKSNLLFADDFTAFVFKDDNGVWPGYVASLKPGFDATMLKNWFTSLEKSPVKDLFISDPGKMAPFKDGLINEKYPDRYSTGAAAGASLGYVMLPQQQKVVISTSFNGLKEALRLMGL